MYYLFAGPVFTKDDSTEILLALGIGLLLAIIPLVLIIWGLLGLKKSNERTRSKRIAILALGIVLLLFVQNKFNLFGWLLH